MASQPILDFIALGSALLHPDITIPDLRTAIGQVSAGRPPVNGQVASVTSSPVAAHWLRHESVSDNDAPVLMWLHGGGFVAGDPTMAYGFGYYLSERAGVRIFAPSYRLAPENPFPAALDDALTAYRALIDQVDPGRVVVGGDSAGGGLALSLLMELRDQHDPLPVAGITFSAWTDMAVTGESLQTRAEYTFGMSEPLVRRCADAYLGGHDPCDSRVSPLYGDFTGLPPLHLQVGDFEVLLADSVRVAERAGAAGVEVEFHVWPEMPHVHQAFVGAAPESDAACDVAADYLRRHLQ